MHRDSDGGGPNEKKAYRAKKKIFAYGSRVRSFNHRVVVCLGG